MKGNEWTRARAAWLAVWLGTGGIAVAVGQNLAETGLEHSRAQWVARDWLVWVKLRRTLDRLTLRADDVDGPKIFLYGEGWDFGEVAALAQGVPFFHAGQDLLRSKSMDRDSFNSGDWFNLLDFTRQQNGWGRGLPLEEHNGGKWNIMRPLLGDAALRPGPQHIEAAHERFLEFLRIRYSSPLFRLSSAEDVRRRLRFHNTGPDQIPGLIVLSLNDAGSISDDGASTSGHVSSSGNPTSPVAPGRRDGSSGAASLPQLDSNYASIVVFFNGRDEAVSLSLESWAGRGVQLHPIQQESADLRLREASCEAETATFTVPPRTTAVFVEPR